MSCSSQCDELHDLWTNALSFSEYVLYWWDLFSALLHWAEEYFDLFQWEVEFRNRNKSDLDEG